MNEITIGDKTYISSKRAAEITGYAKDYVGQLCREGHVDAKMVGRGWYVYEPSIRAHRFGAAEETAPEQEQAQERQDNAPATPEISAPEVSSGWNRTIYTPEEPEMIPEITPAEPIPFDNSSLTDMQSAWKEWFELKQVPEIESPEIIDARMDEYEAAHESEHHEEEALSEENTGEDEDTEVSVPLHKLSEDEEEIEEAEMPVQEESIPIHRVEEIQSRTAPIEQRTQPQHEGRVLEERILTKQKGAQLQNTSGGSNALIVALLVAVSLISIVVAVIGTGLADTYIKTFVGNSSVVDFLLGTRTVIK